MTFVANTEAQNRQMLECLQVTSINDLLQAVPASLRVKGVPADDGLSEAEVLRLMQEIASQNSFAQLDSYLGAGAYAHHIPAIVSAICSKSEFLTAYTPYQAEMSQGGLQAIFEFQSAICALTGMDVANASVYDGASACAEAVLMALRSHPQRSRVLVSSSVHPHYRAVVRQYLQGHAVEIVELPFSAEGRLDLNVLESSCNERTTVLLLQSPNFFGVMEDSTAAFALAKKHGVLSILCANPIAYGIYASASEVGADIAVGDTQPFGLSLQFGGPYVGYMATTHALVRQLPGRLVGQTVDAQGRNGFVLTLQAREQHIRRERATSNICTNQALAALASLVAILWYGPQGLRDLALANFRRASHLRHLLASVPSLKVNQQLPIFNEFVVESSRPIAELKAACRCHRIDPGVELAPFYPKLDRHLLVSVTELKSEADLQRYVEAIRE